VSSLSSSHICVGSCHPVYSPNASKLWSVVLILFLTNSFNSSWCISFHTVHWLGWGHVRKCWAVSLVALHEGHSVWLRCCGYGIDPAVVAICV